MENMGDNLMNHVSASIPLDYLYSLLKQQKKITKTPHQQEKRKIIERRLDVIIQ